MKELGQFYGCDNTKLSSFTRLIWAWDGTDILLSARNKMTFCKNKLTNQMNSQYKINGPVVLFSLLHLVLVR